MLELISVFRTQKSCSGKLCIDTVFDGEVNQEITLCRCTRESSVISSDIKDSSMLADGEASPSNYGESINSPNGQLACNAPASNNGESTNSPVSTELKMSSISPVTSSGSVSFGIQLRPHGLTSNVLSSDTSGRLSQIAHSYSRGVTTSASTMSAHDLRMARDTEIRIKQLSTGDTVIRGKQINLDSSRDFGPVTIESRIARNASSQLKVDTTKDCSLSYTAKPALCQVCQHCVSQSSSTPMSYCEAVQQGLSSVAHCQCTPTKCSMTVLSMAQSVNTSSRDVTSPSIAHLTRLSVGDPIFVQPLAAFARDVSLPTGHTSPVSSAPSDDTAVENISVWSDEQKIIAPVTTYPALSSDPVISSQNTPVLATVDCHTLTAIGKSLQTEKCSYPTCYGRTYQSSGSSVPKHLPNSLRFALSTDYIALGVDSDRGGAYVNLIIADSVASGIDSDRGGGTKNLFTPGRISSRPSSQLSIALLLMIHSQIQLLHDQATFEEDISNVLSAVYCIKPSVRKRGIVDNMECDNFGKGWLEGIFMGSIMV